MWSIIDQFESSFTVALTVAPEVYPSFIRGWDPRSRMSIQCEPWFLVPPGATLTTIAAAASDRRSSVPWTLLDALRYVRNRVIDPYRSLRACNRGPKAFESFLQLQLARGYPPLTHSHDRLIHCVLKP